MKKIILSEYNAIPENYRGIWTVERWDLPDWAEIREKHIGKRTMMVNDNGTCLLVEGIGGLYLKFYSEQGCEPHYADCVIRWCDTLETVEVRIALAMESDTEKDDEIFFYCNSLEDLKSLTDKDGEDFTVAGCLDFGIYEELLQTT